jgi:hypothetical protein
MANRYKSNRIIFAITAIEIIAVIAFVIYCVW